MFIDSDHLGPVFKVISDKGKVYTGISPTKPWTDVCVDLMGRVGKTRVSGPLMFGFSDPIVVHAIESLPEFHLIGTPSQFIKSSRSGSNRGKVRNLPDCSFINLVSLPVPFGLTQYLRHRNGLDLLPESHVLSFKQEEKVLELLKEYERGLESMNQKDHPLATYLHKLAEFDQSLILPPPAE
jgi:hypothetical protein